MEGSIVSDGGGSPIHEIRDQRFMDQLQSLRKLKQFLFQENVAIAAEQLDAIDLGSLNNLTFAMTGRLPSEAEWRILDCKLAGLTALLSPDILWKIKVNDLKLFFRLLPVVVMSVAIGVTFFYVELARIFPDTNGIYYDFGFTASKFIWTIAQGVLGACAFLCVSISMRSSKEIEVANMRVVPFATAEVLDRNALTVRIILGGLFGFLLGLPLSSGALLSINQGIYPENTGGSAGNSPIHIDTYIYLLAPFMFGFSTQLVLAVLDKFLKAISVLFGVDGGSK